MGKIVAILLITISCFAGEVREILSLINKVKHQDFSYKEVSNLYNPFKKRKKLPKIVRKPTNFVVADTDLKNDYQLEVKFQNRVRINNVWYKNGDKIDNYTIHMKKGRVFLINRNRVIELKRKTILKVK